MRKKTDFLCGCLVLLATVELAAAEGIPALPLDELLETAVMAASKRPQKPADAPAMVRVIGADEIRRFGWQTLADALASLPGIHITYDRSYATLGLRGFGRPGDYNSRLLMLIDGVPFNDGVYDQASVGTDFPIDTGLIDRIEYVPGPGSSLYGGNAFFGVVNIVTVSGRRQRNLLEAGLGARGTRTLRAVLGWGDDHDNDWLIAVSRQRQQGTDLFFESYAAPGANAWSRDLDYDNNDRLLARYAHGGFLASLIANSRAKGAPGGPYGADLNDPRNSNGEQGLLLNLSYEHYLDTERKLNVHAYALGYDYEGHWSYDGVLSHDYLVNRVLGGEARMATTLSPAHTMVFGASWRYDIKRRQFNETLDVDSPRRAVGVFLQDDWSMTPWLTLSLGGRFDRIDARTSYQRFSPRVSLIALAGPASVLKLIAGSAFRPPNGFETDYAYAGTNAANPLLRPEYVDSLELGLQHQLARHTEVSASLYENRIRNLITLETDAATAIQQHQNVGAVTAHGLELAASGQWSDLFWRGSLAWQAVRHESGAPVANTPRRLAKLLVTLPLGPDNRLGWEMQYVGPRNAESGSIVTRGPSVGGHALAHATLTGGKRDGFSWQLRLANMFDRRYSSVIGSEFSANYPGVQIAPMPTMRQDGRTLHGSLRWAF